VIFTLGIVALALRSPRWIVAPVGMVFLLWLVAASAILAQTIRKFPGHLIIRNRIQTLNAS
jgi:hypothetical protein